MKPFTAWSAGCLLLSIAAILGCKPGKYPPVIRLDATDTMLVPLHSAIPLPKAIAFDREDLDISDRIVTTGSYDKDSIGYYPIQYEVADAEGNVARATCTLRVMATPSQIMDYYDRTSDCPNTNAQEVVYLWADVQDPNQLVVAALGSGGSFDNIRFNLLPTGVYEPETMPILFYPLTRIVTDFELSFSGDGRIITLDMVVVDGDTFQCRTVFTRR